MEKYIVGIDGGSQSTKVVIYDLKGNIVSEATEKLQPMYIPNKETAEHPKDDLWDSLCIASSKALKAFKGNKNDIIGVGLCTIRCCRALLKADGTLFSPVMSWMDFRLSKNYEHQNDEVAYVTTTSGYITHRLTGEKKDTAANQGGGTMPYDKDTWNWYSDEATFNSFNIKREMLFDLIPPGDILGKITKTASEKTGIPEGVPVVATANDKAVESLGAGLPKENCVLISLGTYIGSMMYGKENSKTAKTYFSNPASMPNTFLYESSGIRRGMWTVSWIKDVLGSEIVEKAHELKMHPESYLDMLAENVPPGSDGLVTILDWLPPPSAPHKRGMMLGFDGRHGKAHMYRSILEAIAMTMKINSFKMLNELNMDVDSIIVSGGGSNSALFMQIFADVYNKKAIRNVASSCASLGTAINVAVALGHYTSYEEANANMVQVRDTFTPIQKNVELYAKLVEVYGTVSDETDTILKKLHAI